jgi:DNA-binding winged helix-turn-helix (wHTH) protein
MYGSRILSNGPFVLDVSARELRRDGVRTRLQEQPCRILGLLLARPGDLVTREELRQELWPAGTFVDFEHSLNAAIKRLRASLGDSAREPRFIETVPGRGYRWRTSSAASSGVRLAVLPFDGGSTKDDFAGGLADEVIAQLGRCGAGRLRVIARMSALACTTAVQRASDVARLLAADYLVEGSVRRHAERERVRIAVWLVDAREEVETWRDVYDLSVADPVQAQVQLASAIADAVVRQLFGSAVFSTTAQADVSASPPGIRGQVPFARR